MTLPQPPTLTEQLHPLSHYGDNAFDICKGIVAEQTMVSVAEMNSSSFDRRIAYARKLVSYALYVKFGFSFEDIAQHWGYKDHSWVSRYCNDLFERKKHNQTIARQINSILCKLTW